MPWPGLCPAGSAPWGRAQAPLWVSHGCPASPLPAKAQGSRFTGLGGINPGAAVVSDRKQEGFEVVLGASRREGRDAGGTGKYASVSCPPQAGELLAGRQCRSTYSRDLWSYLKLASLVQGPQRGSCSWVGRATVRAGRGASRQPRSLQGLPVLVIRGTCRDRPLLLSPALNHEPSTLECPQGALLSLPQHISRLPRGQGMGPTSSPPGPA